MGPRKRNRLKRIMPNDKQNESRRNFLHKLAALGTVGVVTPTLLSACGGGDDGTEVGAEGEVAEADFSCMDTSGLTEEQIQQRENTNYVDETPNEDMRCDNCQLYTEPEEGAQCGGCQVVPGPIHPAGYCDLWVAQQA